jgi:hypothetical protein
MAGSPKPTPEQRRRAVASAVVLAATVLAIYVTFMLKFVR